MENRFWTVAAIFPTSYIRIAHGNDALCCDSLLGTKIAQT